MEVTIEYFEVVKILCMTLIACCFILFIRDIIVAKINK